MAGQKQSGASISDINLRTAAVTFFLLILFSAIIMAAPHAQAQTFQVIHSFTGGVDGAQPLAGVIVDKAGNVYGTTSGAGNGGFCGPHDSTLYQFTENDDAFPVDGPILDKSRNLYGTASGDFTLAGGGVWEITP